MLQRNPSQLSQDKAERENPLVIHFANIVNCHTRMKLFMPFTTLVYAYHKRGTCVSPKKYGKYCICPVPEGMFSLSTKFNEKYIHSGSNRQHDHDS